MDAAKTELYEKISKLLTELDMSGAQFARLIGEKNPNRWTYIMLESGLKALESYKRCK